MILASNDNVIVACRGNSFKIYTQTDIQEPIFTRRLSHTISFVHCSAEFALIGLFNGDVHLFAFKTCFLQQIVSLSARITKIFAHGNFYYIGSEEGEVIVLYLKETANREPCKQELLSSAFYDESAATDFTVVESTDCDIGSYAEQSSSNGLYIFTVVRKILHPAAVVSLAANGPFLFVLDMRGKVTQYPKNISYDVRGSCMEFKRYLFVSEGCLLFCLTKEAFASFLEAPLPITSFSFSKTGGVLLVKHDSKFVLYDNNAQVINEIEFDAERYVLDEVRNRILVFDGFKIDAIDRIVAGDEFDKLQMPEVEFSKSKISTKVVSGRFDEDTEVFSKFIETADSRGLTNLGKIEKIQKIANKTEDLEDSSSNIKSNDLVKSRNFISKDYFTNSESSDEGILLTRRKKTITNKNLEIHEQTIEPSDNHNDRFGSKKHDQKDFLRFDGHSDNTLVGKQKNEADTYTEYKTKQKKRKRSRFIDDQVDSTESENEIDERSESDASDPETLIEQEVSDTKRKTIAQRLFDSSESEESVPLKSVCNIKAFVSGAFTAEDASLMFYNVHGHIISYGGIIEAIFTDSDAPLQSFSKQYSIGALYSDFSVFADKDAIHVQGKHTWHKNFQSCILLSITDAYVVAISKTECVFYSHSGILICSIAVQNPITVASQGEDVVVYENSRLLVFDKFLNTKSIMFTQKIDFLCIFDKNIYCARNNTLLVLKNDVSIKIFEFQDYPVCVNEGFLLTCSGKLFPSPHINYHRITTNNDISDAFMLPSTEISLRRLLNHYQNLQDSAKVKVLEGILCAGEEDFDTYIPHFRSISKVDIAMNIEDESVVKHEKSHPDTAEILENARLKGKPSDVNAEYIEENVQKPVQIQTVRINPFARKK